MHSLRSPADLVAAAGGDPLVRHLLPHLTPGAPILATEGAVLFAYDYWDGTGAQLIGSRDAAVELLLAGARELSTDYVAVPEQTVPLLRDLITPELPWCFRWTDVRPPVSRADARWLDASEHGDVEALLDSSFPTASARPGNPHTRRWAGIRDADGVLIATAADATETDIGFMASVASDVRRRRSGLGLAMTAWMTHELLDTCGIAALWQYSDNTAAAALYDKLGFRDDHRYVGSVITPR